MDKNREYYLNILAKSIDPDDAVDHFENWFTNKVKLDFGKKLMPLAYDYAKQRPFIVDWLGPNIYDHIFSPQYRDILPAALLENDKADFQCRYFPFAKTNLQYLCSASKVERLRPHNLMQDCMVIAEVYRRMLKTGGAVLKVVEDIPDETVGDGSSDMSDLRLGGDSSLGV